MCGIAAHFSFQGEASALDLSCIAHRGPDDSGEWLSRDRRVWLGNTRLAILDPSPTGRQPMTDPSTGNVIVSNGEIYNHWAIRAELGESISWRGTSDTETLLQAYARWGRDLLPRLKGMFAFAIYDAERRELFTARDRLGVKPLYFRRDADGVGLASEVKVLFDESLGISDRAIAAYLRWGACPEEHLLYEQIQVVPAGHFAVITGRDFKLARYWPSQPAFISSPSEAPQKIRALLEATVEEHLLSDVPVASFLSGGIDSSIVTALAAQRLKRKLQTFSVGFAETGCDETSIALEVARRYGTEHHRLELSEDEVLDSVTEAVAKLDLPSVDAINTYLVARAVARRGVKVALSGLGGDELFGGYSSFRDVPRLKWIARLPRSAQKRLGQALGFGGRLADLPRDGNAGELAQWRRRFFTDEVLMEAGLPTESTELDCPVGLPDDFARISWAELSGYMRRMLLRDSDQMSMAVSLELRVPFLDHALVEYSLGLPAAEKRRYGPGKGLLTEATRDLLPAAVYERPKTGFALPMANWMKGPLAGFVAEGLTEVTSRNLLPRDFVSRLRAQFEKDRLHWTRLWSIVVLGHFVRRNHPVSHRDETPARHTFA